MEKIRFDNFIKLNRGFDLPDAQIEEGTYPVVASTSIKAYHNEYKVEGPMVTTGRSGSLGKVVYIEGKCWPLNTTLYVKDYKGNVPRYVYYYLQMMHLEQFNAGAGVPTLNQNHLHSIKLLVHSKKEQQKIASILSTYDTLIENNTKRIRLLEQMAENLYKEWFVRFRFPGHENVEMENGLPKGWKVERIKECVKRLPYGRTYKENELSQEGSVIVIDQSTSELLGYHNNAPSHYASFDSPIILFGDHSCKFCFMTRNFSLGENVIPFISKDANEIDICFLYFATHKLIVTEEYKRHWGRFSAMKILIPQIELQQKFSKLVIEFEKLKQSLIAANSLLTRQRDLLLPRLMSGKLEVTV